MDFVVTFEHLQSALLAVFNAKLPSEHQSSMQELERLEKCSGFVSNLLLVIQQCGSNHFNEALLCVICLKNLINRQWVQRDRSEAVLSLEDKILIRNFVSSWNPPIGLHKAGNQIAIITGKIARQDWPMNWPNLFDILFSKINSDIQSDELSHVIRIIDMILRELSTKTLPIAKKEFRNTCLRLFPSVLRMWFQCLESWATPLTSLCSGILTDSDVSVQIVQNLEKICILTDILYYILVIAFSNEVISTLSDELSAFFQTLGQLLLTGPFNVIAILRQLAKNFDEDSLSAVISYSSVEYSEEFSLNALDNSANLKACVYHGSCTRDKMMDSITKLLAIFVSQIVTFFPAMCKTNGILVGRFICPFIDLYLKVYQSERTVVMSSPNRQFSGLSETTLHVCIMFISQVLSFKEYSQHTQSGEQVPEASNMSIRNVILSQSLTAATVASLVDDSVQILLCKSADKDIKIWIDEQSEYAAMQESLVERDSLRVASEGFFLSLLDLYPDQVSAQLFQFSNSLLLHSELQLQLLLLTQKEVMNVFSHSKRLSNSVIATMYHTLLSLDALLLCVGIGAYHFQFVVPDANAWLGSVIVPVTEYVLRSRWLDNVMIGSVMITPREGAAVLLTRLLWLISCWIFTINSADLYEKLIEIVILSFLPFGNNNDSVDIVSLLQSCDTLTSMLHNFQNATNDPSERTKRSLYYELLKPMTLQLPGTVPFNVTGTHRIRVLLHVLCNFVLNSVDSVDLKTKVILLITEIVSLYSMSVLIEYQVDTILFQLLKNFVDLWQKLTINDGYNESIDPSLLSTILEAIIKLLGTVNNNVGQLMISQSFNGVELLCGVTGEVVDMIHATIAGPQIGLGTSSANGDEICPMVREGVQLWSVLMRSLPMNIGNTVITRKNGTRATIDSILLELFGSSIPRVFSCDVLNCNSSHEEYKDVFMIIEAYALRYFVKNMSEFTGDNAGVSAVVNGLALCVEKSLGNVLPRAVGTILRTWNNVLLPLRCNQSLVFMFHVGMLRHIFRSIIASVVENKIVSFEGVVETFGQSNEEFHRIFSSHFVEYVEQDVATIQYLSIFAYCLLNDVICSSKNWRNSVIFAVLFELTRDVLCRMQSDPKWSQVNNETVQMCIMRTVITGIFKLMLDKFECLGSNSKYVYFTRRLWSIALLSSFPGVFIPNSSIDLLSLPESSFILQFANGFACNSYMKELCVDFLSLLVVTVEGSRLPALENCTFHSELVQCLQEQSIPTKKCALSSLCSVMLTKAITVEDIDDEDDDIECEENAWDADVAVEDEGIEGIPEILNDDDEDGSACEDFSAPEVVKDSIVYVYMSEFMHLYQSNERSAGSDVLKVSIESLLRSRVLAMSELCKDNSFTAALCALNGYDYTICMQKYYK